MKKVFLITLGLALTMLVQGQTIKLQGGVSFSTLDWKLTVINVSPIFDETLIGHSVFIGMDYLEKPYYNLSSNIGLIRKGGQDHLILMDTTGVILDKSRLEKATLDYLTFNTTLDLKYTIKETFTPFVSFGPRFDYLINYSNNAFEIIYKTHELNKYTWGMIFGGGAKYDVSKLQFGLRADYYLDFTKVADWKSNGVTGDISTKTFAVSLSVGYKLR